MGNGSTLVIFNGTQQDWNLGRTSSYQMNHWTENFPKTIKPGTAGFVYFEYDQSPRKTRSDTGAEASYTFGSMNFKFMAKDQPERLSVEINGVRTSNNPSGSQVMQQLKWLHDDWTEFAIISRGKTDRYVTQLSSADWMQQNLDWLGTRPLHTICMPGSHNAGMSSISQVYAGDVSAIRDFMGPLCLCQKGTVAEQLRYGSRYLDVRPFISGGSFWTGHYSGTNGARGQSISDIVEDINRFTAQSHELVIVHLSHMTNSDEKQGKNWRENFNQSEWSKLFDLLTKINNRFIAKDDDKNQKDLSKLTLNDLIGGNKSAVIVIADVPNASAFAGHVNQGFFTSSQLNTFDQYSDTPVLNVMVDNQLKKMREFMVRKDPGIFLLSWTLTQHIDEIVKTILDPVKLRGDGSIAGLAAQANKSLFTSLLPNVSETAFPNIIYLDYLHGVSLYAGIALAANAKVKSG